MPPKINRIGLRFGRFVVIEEAPSRLVGKGIPVTVWKVKCDCGEERTVRTSVLTDKRKGKSCGCLIKEGNARKHGEAYKTSEYVAWQLMKRRAEKSKGRVNVCDRWKNSYENFLADMGRKPSSNHSLDRRNGGGHYEPSNCRWATRQEQAQNIRTNRLITYQGETKCLTQWAREYGLEGGTLRQRLEMGRSIKESLTTEVRYRVRKEKSVSKVPEYRIWKSMKGRCMNSTNFDYAQYGGRGIKICDRWVNSFKNFVEDVGNRPSLRHSLDRIDSDGNYCPENCRWVDGKIQARNRRNNKMITYQGETLCLVEWAEKLGISYYALRARLQKGWDVERALNTKVRSI